ncbi:MAG: photosystem II reaction center protein Ycf12 [Cyanobacteria bacterium CRU_2_1]|nr:photosystem II reaction center protein Ycf12 [Cyanobacteria bacterium RU_5_0]NJR60343.1 photosystem II reaction center protein Ycf12 [Cyanobacteria bacterium CRU_2_1]
MDFVADLFSGAFSAFGNISWEVIAQLTMLALIVIAGPAVVFVLALRGGDL